MWHFSQLNSIFGHFDGSFQISDFFQFGPPGEITAEMSRWKFFSKFFLFFSTSPKSSGYPSTLVRRDSRSGCLSAGWWSRFSIYKSTIKFNGQICYQKHVQMISFKLGIRVRWFDPIRRLEASLVILPSKNPPNPHVWSCQICELILSKPCRRRPTLN